MILVDTSVLIDFLAGRDNPPVGRFEEILDRQIPYGISLITFTEVLQGAATEKDFHHIREYLESQVIFDLREGPDSYAAAAKIFFDLRRKGRGVSSSLDCLIARTAIEHDLHLLHSDSDFERIATVAPLKIW